MECGTLNENEAVCRELSVETDLLPLFSWKTAVELGLLLPRCHWISFPLSCLEIEVLRDFLEKNKKTLKTFNALLL